MLHIDHTMLHPMQPHLICNSKFPCFTTVQQNWSNTTHINLPLFPVALNINPAFQLTYHLTPRTCSTYSQFLHSLILYII